jgi:hypothetical protein
MQRPSKRTRLAGIEEAGCSDTSVDSRDNDDLSSLEKETHSANKIESNPEGRLEQLPTPTPDLDDSQDHEYDNMACLGNSIFVDRKIKTNSLPKKETNSIHEKNEPFGFTIFHPLYTIEESEGKGLVFCDLDPSKEREMFQNYVQITDEVPKKYFRIMERGHFFQNFIEHREQKGSDI